MKLSIIIPVYNEEHTIKKILEEVCDFKKENSLYEIIIVNDGSTDQTLNVLEKNKTLYDHLITYEKNGGKGFAVKEGLKFAKASTIRMVLIGSLTISS